MFIRLMQEPTLLHFITNLFYDMQPEFQNKVILHKNTRKFHFITSLEHILFSNTTIIRTFTKLGKGLFPISEVLTVFEDISASLKPLLQATPVTGLGGP
jgi:hypothetical protein